MPEKEEKLSNEPMVDLDTSGPGASVDLPDTQKEEEKTYEKEEKKMKQMLRTMISPLTHLRNLMSSLMFEITRTKAERLKRKLLKKGVISSQLTKRKWKNILKELRKE